jgi:hypothetical protein
VRVLVQSGDRAVSGQDYGPLRTYEITWRNRPPEIVQGHQVLFESGGFEPRAEPKFRIHGMFGTHWRLMIMAPEADVICIRDVTDQIEALEAMNGEAGQ